VLHISRQRVDFVSNAIVEQLYDPSHSLALSHFCNVSKTWDDGPQMVFTPYVLHAIIGRMSRDVDDIIRTLSRARRTKVEARAADLIAEEMTLQELRRAGKLTKVSGAKALGITQDSVSRLENRRDILLSTLRKRK
jgi:hypothetical protein